MKIEDKAYFAMEPNLQGMKKVRDEIYALAQTHLRLSEKSTDSQKQNYEYRIAAGLSSFVSRAPYAAEIGMEFKGSAYWNKKAIQLAKEGAALGVIADKLIAEALSIYNSHSKPVEDKAYFDGGYFRTAATPLSLFTKDLRETLRRLAAFAECPILGYGKLTTQSEFSNKINQLKTWITADIAKIEKDKLKEKESSNWIRTMDRWIEKRKEVLIELKKIEDTKISLLPTVAKNAMPVEDKAYFDRRIYHSTGTFHTLLDKETRVPIDGTSKWVTVDPAQYITPRRVRISGIKGEIEIAAQLSGDEIKGISAKAVKATAARQGSKAKFANFKVGQIVKYKNPNSDEDPNQKYIIKEVNGDRGFMETHGGYFKDSRFPPRMLYQQNEIMLASRTGTKFEFASDTNYAHKNTIKIKGKSDKIYALIYAEEGYGDNLTGFWNGHVQNNTNPKVNDIVTIGQFKSKEAAKAAAIKALKQEEQGTNFSKAKFANRGAFAEASSSPVLGSLLEKKVMPEGGWRAVETDGGALVIAFEDGDIAGNFARRASENGYSATAPMAMAGRFWNVKVKNENKQ